MALSLKHIIQIYTVSLSRCTVKKTIYPEKPKHGENTNYYWSPAYINGYMCRTC